MLIKIISFFNKVVDLHRVLPSLKKGLWYRCFPVRFNKYLRIPFLQNTCFLQFHFWFRGFLHVKFHPRMKLSRDEIIPVYGEMSLTVYMFLPRWNFMLGWKTDEISSWDEKKKKRRVNTSSRDEILKWACFFNFWRIIQVCFPNSACLNTMKVWI